MKKIFLFIAILSALISKAQFPNQQSLGTSKTEVFARGAFGADSGFVYRTNFPDTIEANKGFIKNIPGMVIRTGNILWLRNQTVNAWIEIGSGGGSSDTANLYIQRIGLGVPIWSENNDTLLFKDIKTEVFLLSDIDSDGSLRLRIDTNNTDLHDYIGLWGGRIEGLTPGSVLFIGADGKPAEDAGIFNYDNTQNFLGLGTATPLARLHVSGNDPIAILAINTTGGNPNTSGGFIAAGIDDGSPQEAGDRMGTFVVRGNKAAGNPNNSFGLEVFSIQTWTTGTAGAEAFITLTPPGQLERDTILSIQPSGRLGIGEAVADPIARLDIAAGSTTLPQFVLRSTTLTTTPVFGAMNFKDGLWFIDSSTSVRDTVATREWARANIQGAGGGSGETNTASNLGGGLANYSTKVGVDLQFNSFLASHFNLVSNQIEVDTANLFPIIRSTIPAGGGGASTIVLTDTLLVSGTSFTTPADITTSTVFIIRGVGGGGGGAGQNTANTKGAGGGAGGAFQVSVSGLSPSTAYTYAIGAAGAAGTGAPTDGGNGGNTSITINGTTYTGNGGTGGESDVSSPGGAGGTATNGDINITGQNGYGTAASSAAVPGSAGGTPGLGWGIGGAGQDNSGPGIVATGYGGGGSGGVSTGQAGAAGTQGAIYMQWIVGSGGGSGTPGGSDTHVQFNDGGSFGGDAGMVYNKTTDALTIGGSLLPDANDGAVIGSTTLQFSDLFLAEGGVINWDNGDATLTQVGNVITLAGANLRTTLLASDDLTLVGLDVDASPDTLTSIEGGVISKYVIPIISGYTAVDSLMSGQYTPTLANVTNVAGTTAVLVNYQKVGSIVHVQGVGSCTVTASGGTLTTMSITLPFASAMTLVTDCSGSGTARTSAAALPAYVATNTTTDVAEVSFYSGTGSHDVHFSFTYKVK